MKNLTILLILLITSTAFAVILPGSAAPDFSVSDGNNKVLRLRDLRGKVVIGFYEHRNTTKINESLKNELNRYRTKWKKYSSGTSFRLAVTDASEANLFTRWVWRNKIKEKSKQLGITIYGDWDGSMRKAYGLPVQQSVFIIIDKEGTIRYIHTGRVPKTKFAVIKNLIKQLTTN